MVFLRFYEIFLIFQAVPGDATKEKQKEKEQEKDDTVHLSRKGTKIGHTRIDEAGQITYKKV